MAAEANGNGAPAGAIVLPVEQVEVGWVRLPDGSYRTAVTFTDEWGRRTHLMDDTATRTVGEELIRLGKFLAAGLEPPPAGQLAR